MRLRFFALLATLLASAPLLSACDDNGLLGTLILSSDTTLIARPGSPAASGSAIDIVRSSGNFDMVRNPELVRDAEQWDLAVRSTENGLVLRPFTPVASPLRGAGIAVATRSFESLDEAPRATSAYGSDPVPVTLNGVYLLRSRQFTSSTVLCVKYAKLKVVAMDAAAGTVRMAVVINEGCDDERLADD